MLGPGLLGQTHISVSYVIPSDYLEVLHELTADWLLISNSQI